MAPICLISGGATCYHGLMFRPCSLLLMFFLAVPALAPASFAKECKCRLYEQRVEIGAFACVNGKLAQCMMFQNVASWKFLSDTCPLSRKSTPSEPNPKAQLAAR
jgi:hypothetical protein